jgi:hypothetical protein
MSSRAKLKARRRHVDTERRQGFHFGDQSLWIDDYARPDEKNELTVENS